MTAAMTRADSSVDHFFIDDPPEEVTGSGVVSATLRARARARNDVAAGMPSRRPHPLFTHRWRCDRQRGERNAEKCARRAAIHALHRTADDRHEAGRRLLVRRARRRNGASRHYPDQDGCGRATCHHRRSWRDTAAKSLESSWILPALLTGMPRDGRAGRLQQPDLDWNGA